MNPDFDDLVLDEALYRELGMTPEEIEEHRAGVCGASGLGSRDGRDVPEEVEEHRAGVNEARGG